MMSPATLFAAAALAVGGTGAGWAQAQAPAAPVPPAAVPASVVAPVPRVDVHWSAAAARALLDAIAAAPAEGLDAAPYRADLVQAALAQGEGPALDQAARTAALALASDYFDGRVADKAQFDWHIDRSPYLAMQLPAQLDKAVADGRVREWLDGLLPQNDEYRALKAALADAGDDRALAGRLRANLERWRWMPRTLGPKYLYVNVPSYELQVMADGAEIARYTVVVGAPRTPTPMMSLTAQSIVVNPWWNVPQSIVKSSNLRPGRGGYQFVRTADGYAVRQAPGAANALGKVKIDMPNDQAIYLHDTPAKRGFAQRDRALSHGCIRVANIDQLAASLMTAGGGDTAAFDDAYAGRDTRTLPLAQQWPVYLVYFTARADAAGKVRMLPDPYDRDAPLLAALDRRVMIASR